MPDDDLRSRVAEALDVSPSLLHARAARRSKARGLCTKPDDAELLPALRKLVAARPTYGYRRIKALLNRRRRGPAWRRATANGLCASSAGMA